METSSICSCFQCDAFRLYVGLCSWDAQCPPFSVSCIHSEQPEWPIRMVGHWVWKIKRFLCFWPLKPAGNQSDETSANSKNLTRFSCPWKVNPPFDALIQIQNLIKPKNWAEPKPCAVSKAKSGHWLAPKCVHRKSHCCFSWRNTWLSWQVTRLTCRVFRLKICRTQ